MEKEYQIALDIAQKAHKEQKDKVGADYILHPIKVSEYCASPYAKIVALLHDVVEDSEITLDDLRKARIGEDVIAAVDCLTKRSNEKLEEYYSRIATNKIAIEVKFADMRHNSDETRWGSDMKIKAIENAYKYWKRMEKLYNLVGGIRLKEILSNEMYVFVKDCILQSHQ